jgi:CheY-like chemotaxis protein
VQNAGNEAKCFIRDSRPCRGRPALADDGSRARVFAMCLEITSAKAAKQALFQSKLEAERASGAKSDFLATMSHEIRTPMNGVTALLEDTRLSAEQKHYVKTIRQSGEALVGLIDDILDFSKLEAGQMEIERRAFGADGPDVETRSAAVIGGALTPGRLAPMLEPMEQAGSSREDSRESPRKSPRRLKILIADDTEPNRDALLGLPRRLDHEAETVVNGLAVPTMSKSNDDDLIFMDVHMPEIDGLETTRRIRGLSGEKASVRILAMTASAFASDIEACRVAGMDDFVSKPVDGRKLAAALNKTNPGRGEAFVRR